MSHLLNVFFEFYEFAAKSLLVDKRQSKTTILTFSELYQQPDSLWRHAMDEAFVMDQLTILSLNLLSVNQPSRTVSSGATVYAYLSVEHVLPCPKKGLPTTL